MNVTRDKLTVFMSFVTRDKLTEDIDFECLRIATRPKMYSKLRAMSVTKTRTEEWQIVVETRKRRDQGSIVHEV